MFNHILKTVQVVPVIQHGHQQENRLHTVDRAYNSLAMAIGFKPGILCPLKMVQWHRNMT